MAMFRLMFAVPLLVIACADDGAVGDKNADDDRSDQGKRNGNCSMLPSLRTNAAVACYDYGSIGGFVADELVTIWQSDANSICAYLPSDRTSNSCGPLGANNALYCSTDNSVAWDIQFLEGEHARHGDFAPVSILAHEWGHLNQNRVGFSGTVFQEEQNADCFGGLFAAVEEDRGLLDMGDVIEAFSSLCSNGGTSGFFDPSSHGTCEERLNAFNHGYIHGLQQLSGLCGEKPLETAFSICATIPLI